MTPDPDRETPKRLHRLRRWAVRFGIGLVVLEVLYVIAANAFLRSGALLDLINKKPEKDRIRWGSAVTYLPGVAIVTGFELWSQTARHQVYLKVDEADARIAIPSLLFKTIHIKGVDARNVDFRYRPRLDRPPRQGEEDTTAKRPVNPEHWPEMPGLANPPDPKPEDLYPRKRQRRPWTIKISGADVEGSITVALADVRIEGNGYAGGGVTVKPKRTITIHRGKLDLPSTKVVIGPEPVTDNLAINANVTIDAFPAKGAKLPDVLGEISGKLSLAGRLSDRAAVRHEITPGISTFGAGTVAVHLELEDGVMRDGSVYSLESEAFQLRIMGLDANGTASMKGRTVREGRDHLTRGEVRFDDFSFVDPDSRDVGVSGTGVQLDAEWNGLSLAGTVPASRVEVVVPPTPILDVAVFNGLIPEQALTELTSGTGVIAASLVVEDRVAAGELDLVAQEIVLQGKEVPFYGDLEVHAVLAEGSLPEQRFDFSGTTLRLDNIVGEELSNKEMKKLAAWFCAVDLRRGVVTIGRPMSADAAVGLTMFDTRPLVGLMSDIGDPPGWLKLMPNVKDIDGRMNLRFGPGFVEIDDLDLTGKKLHVRGDVAIRNKLAHGRLLIEYGIVLAGLKLDQGKGKIVLSKPRKWFEGENADPKP
jgi:hypothetical protein